MHQTFFEYRRIPPTDLPQVRGHDGKLRVATTQELQDLGIVCVNVGENLYACARQEDGYLERTDDGRLKRLFRPVDSDRVANCGACISTGDLYQRHATLPPDVAPHIMRATVITGKPIIEASLAAQQDALSKNVGDVAGKPPIDLSSDEAKLSEAERQLQLAEPDVYRTTVPMADVDPLQHITEKENVIPHAWAGEM